MLDVLAAILTTAAVATAIVGLRRPEKSRVPVGVSALTTAGLLALVLLRLEAHPLVPALGVACLMLGVVVGAARRRQDDDAADSRLQRHLARCRRREESASALVVALRDGARLPKDVTQPLRITDSAVVTRAGRRWEMRALFDGDDVPRDIVEERLRSELGASTPAFGWATFPAHGLTLEALLEHARAEAGRAAASADRPVAASSRAPDDPAPAT